MPSLLSAKFLPNLWRLEDQPVPVPGMPGALSLWRHVHLGHMTLPGPDDAPFPRRYLVRGNLRTMLLKRTGGQDSYLTIQAALFLGEPPGGVMIPGTEVTVNSSRQGEWNINTCTPCWHIQAEEADPRVLDVRFSVLLVEGEPGQNPVYLPNPTPGALPANLSPNWLGVAGGTSDASPSGPTWVSVEGPLP
jgi:hypothetical protein